MSTITEKIRGLADTIKRGIERFPLTVCFALVLTVCAIILEYKGYHGISDKWRFFMLWYPATGIALSLSLSLWLEEHTGKTGYIFAVAIIHVIWIGVSTMLMKNYNMLGYAPYTYVIAALIVVLMISLLVLSFFKDKTDVPFWNFSLRSTGAVIAGFVVSGIVCGGLELLIFAIEKLFGVFINSHCYSNVATICFCLLAPILVLQGVPGGALKHDDEPMSMPRLIENAATKLFMPIAAAYLITLYCYAAKILFTWQLPDGWVSWLVTASMMAMILLLMMVYPYREKASQSASSWNRMTVQFITNRMPVLMLPLLLLMSIGIARRLSDYGITIQRIYLIAFNLWCYAVCLILIIRRKPRIMWIPVSFILLFAIMTLLPINVSTCVKKNLTAKVTAALQENGWDGASMSDSEYSHFLQKLDPKTAAQIDSRIDYLKRQFSKQYVEEFIGTDVFTGRPFVRQNETNTDEIINIERYRSILGSIRIDLPSDASQVAKWSGSEHIDKECITGDTLILQLPVASHTKDDKGHYFNYYYEFRFPLSQLRAINEEMTIENIARDNINHAISYTGTLVDTSAKDAPYKVVLYIDTFNLYRNDDEGHFNVNGLLFLYFK